MKKRNYIAAIMLASLMATSAAVCAMPASASNNTITITLPTNDKATHTYEAYQVFKGDLDDGVLSNIQWGDHINSTTLLSKLAADSAFTIATDDKTPAITATSSAANVAKYLAKYNDAATAKKFADYVNASLNSTAPISGTFTPASGSNAASAVIDVTDTGYYFVKDKDDSLATTNADGAYTKFVLKVVGPATVTAKEDVPSITKKIVENSTEVSVNTASIGDSIPYVLHSTVPDMTNFDSYCYVINDTMETGLTFNDDVAITIGSDTLVNKATLTSDQLATTTKWFEVQTNEDADGYTFQIVLNNFKQYSKDAEITVNYSATLNQNAELYTDSNDNTVSLTYSNNPNFDYSGSNEPGSTAPKGITPESQTQTYTTALKLLKVDEDGNALTGAGFTITGDGVKTVIVMKDSFVESTDAEATYYKLNDGTFTTEAPDGTNDGSYASTEKKYKKTTTSTPITKDTGVNVTAEVDGEGYLVFKGLGSGTYTISETTVPAGYNKINDFDVTISDNHTSVTASNPFEFTASSPIATPNDLSFDTTEKVFKLSIENHKGSTLPSTGGIGTTIFYVVGGTLVAGAVVLLIIKKRMSVNEDK